MQLHHIYKGQQKAKPACRIQIRRNVFSLDLKSAIKGDFFMLLPRELKNFGPENQIAND